MLDLHYSLKFTRAISPVSVADNTALVSQIIDRANFPGLEFAIATGSLADADATFTVLVEDGNQANLSDAAPVADQFLLGLESQASFTFAADDSTKKIGYIGAKRYVRLTITPANNTGAAVICVIAIQGGGRKQPVS